MNKFREAGRRQVNKTPDITSDYLNVSFKQFPDEKHMKFGKKMNFSRK